MTSVRQSGKALLNLLEQPLNARPAGDQAIGVRAGRAAFGNRSAETAVMALKPAEMTVFDKPGRAVGAGKAVATGTAQGQGRITAPVEEQQPLLARVERRLKRLDHRRRQPAPAFGAGAASCRPPSWPEASRRHGARQALRPQYRPSSTLTRVSIDGVAEHSTTGTILQPAPDDCHVAGVVADAVLLLERGVVFLIDNDQTEIGERQRRARSGRRRRHAPCRP